ncbi:MAG: adenine phosphoribosyltransferase [Lachnospiraceae bacterium]|nr:adenine phosphoribosyltransferase [Lachnospiraceae bacterium]
MKDLKEYIRSIPDFPKPGIIFRDITTLIQNPEGFKESIDLMDKALSGVDFDYVVAMEARGFVFGAPIAYKNDKGLVLARKKGKLPYKTIETTYDLEYGSATLELHEDALKKGDKVVLIDDLLATGGTLEALAGLVESTGAEISKIMCVIELPALKGRERLGKYQVETFVSFEGD